MKECEFDIPTPESGIVSQKINNPMAVNLEAASGFKKFAGFAVAAVLVGSGCGGGGVVNGGVLGSFEAKQNSRESTPTPYPMPRYEPTPTTCYPNAGKLRSALDFTRDNGVCPSQKTVGEMNIPNPQVQGGLCPGTDDK